MYILRCSVAFSGRAPTRPNTPSWLPDSSTARSRSTPFEIVRALAPSGSLKLAISRGVGRGLNPCVPRRLGRRELHDAQAILAVSQVGELADISDPELHVVQVIDAPAAIEDLVDPGSSGVDVQDHQPLRTGRDVSIRSGQVNSTASRSGRLDTGCG